MMGSKIHQKTVHYLAMIIAVVALSACGDKKEARGTQPGESAPPQQQTAPQTDRMEEVNGGLEIPLPGPRPPGEEDGAAGNPGSGPISAPSPTPGSQVGNPPAPKLPDQNDTDGSEAGYDPVDPKQIERSDIEKRYTGMEDDDGLFYTGSSTDYLLTYLRLRNDDKNLDTRVRARNLEAAQSIESARMSIDKFSGDLTITLKMRENNLTKTYTLAGGVDDETRISGLRVSSSSKRGRTTGSQQIEGKIKCLDLHQNSCETSFARLLIGTPGQRAVVGIIFRQSLADYHVKFTSAPEDPRDQNSEYEFIRKFWKNTNNSVNTHHKLKNIFLNSFEVVNGRSGFDVQILGEGRQLISFGGPLLAPDVGTAVNITADRTPQVIESLDLDSLTNYNYEMADFIGGAKIVNNNGVGQIRLTVKMRARAGNKQDAFKLTIMRIIKPTMTANEENLRLD